MFLIVSSTVANEDEILWSGMKVNHHYQHNYVDLVEHNQLVVMPNKYGS